MTKGMEGVGEAVCRVSPLDRKSLQHPRAQSPEHLVSAQEALGYCEHTGPQVIWSIRWSRSGLYQWEKWRGMSVGPHSLELPANHKTFVKKGAVVYCLLTTRVTT